MICNEEWRPVSGFEGIYEVSNLGRIKSYKQDSCGIIIRLTNSKGDYIRFVLQAVGKKQKTVLMHRLVAETFIDNPHNMPVVNHIDGNKQNNCVDNLEWCSVLHNVNHSIRMHPEQLDGMILYNKYGKTEPILQISKHGEVLHWFPSGAEASRITGVCARNIMQVANHTPFKPGHLRKTAGGFVWRFEREVILK